MLLSQLVTPALVLDRTRLVANCLRMAARCRALGVNLRPHMKTLKSTEAASYAVGEGARRIAVASLSEAEYFADRGFEDIQYAVCISPDKFHRAAHILRKASRFSFFLDSVAVARQVAEFARLNQTPLRVWLEIDSGQHRTGIDPGTSSLTESVEALRSSPVIFEGVATHAGQSYCAFGQEALRAVAELERSTIVAAAQSLRAAGFAVPGVSAGSTPTAVHAISGDGLSEYRAGVYMAGDLFQVALGSMSLDDCAVTVLATVISRNADRNQIVIDAGALALSKDRSTATGPGPDMGYGLLLDECGTPIAPGLIIGDVHQEHGQIRVPSSFPFDRFSIGSKVRVVPNHACMTAAMYDRYVVVDGSTEIKDIWERTNGWT